MTTSLGEQPEEQEIEGRDPRASAPSPQSSAVGEVTAAAGFAEREIFWNLPNTITVLRVGVVPILLALPWAQDPLGSEIIAWCFIVAAVTDIIDGWLARRGQMVTRIGKLLDPLADKLLVSTAFVMLVATGRVPLWATWMVVVIIGRELAVTGLRGIASAGGTVMGASWLGKTKTTTQNIAIGALLFHYTTFGLPAHQVGLIFLCIATVLTLWSGYLYFAQYFGGDGSGAPK